MDRDGRKAEKYRKAKMKKYEFTGEEKLINNHTLHRIRAVRDFGIVKAGNLGGWIEKEENLSHAGNAWVGDNACVIGAARVGNNAWVTGAARVTDNAKVIGAARVTGNALVGGAARVTGDAWVGGNAWVGGDARVGGDDDFSVISGFGRFSRTTTFFRCQDGKVRTQCGCFYGDLDEFRAKVKETHGESKMAKEYLMIADLMEMHFASEE